MSQEKVDKYKKEKASRQKIMRREKWLFRLECTATVLVLGGLIAWFSMAVYSNVQAQRESEREAVTTTMNVTGIQDYLSEISSSREDTDTAQTE